jgi:hypothetical protein
LKRKIWILFLVVGFCVLFAGILVFSAWVGGMTLGLMGNAEQAAITNIRFVENVPTGDTIKVTVRNSGTSTVTVAEGFSNGIKATNISSGQAFIIPKASFLEITLTFPSETLVYGTQQQVKLITTRGNSVVYSVMYDSASTSQYDPFKDDIIPTPSTFYLAPSPYEQEQAKVLFSTLFLTVIADVGACLFANYIIQPRNRRELFVMLFFVTIIVVFAIVAVVFTVLFPPQPIGLM